MLQIKKATKEQIKLRMAIDGPTGSGKTYSSLRFAQHLAGNKGSILVIDSERRSASKYVGEAPDGIPWEFDVIDLPSFSPDTYVEAINLASQHGYDVIVIDSLSHAWMGKDGTLELVDKKGGKFQAWRDVTPMHNKMVDTILECPAHVIVTMRSKMEYAMEELEENGRKKTVVNKLGMAPVQRQGVEYEFDVIIDMDQTNTANVTKSRCSAIAGERVHKPTPAFINPVIEWLDSGEPIPSFVSFEDMMFELSKTFELKEDEVKEGMKYLGFTKWPQEDVHRRQRSKDIYIAFQQRIEEVRSYLKRIDDAFDELVGKEVKQLDKDVREATAQ